MVQTPQDTPVKRTVLDVDDVVEMVPRLRGHEKLVKRALHWLQVDRVNDVHSRGFDHPGPDFVKFLLDDFNIKLRIDNEQVLDNLPESLPRLRRIANRAVDKAHPYRTVMDLQLDMQRRSSATVYIILAAIIAVVLLLVWLLID